MGLIAAWRATRAGFKPRDVEEPIDYYWHRPLAGLLVTVLLPLPITPNQVTLLSGLFSVLAGCAIALSTIGSPWWCTLGGTLLLFSIILDCADGQLARLRGISSPLGRAIDGMMDTVAPISVLCAMTACLLHAGYAPVWVWTLGWGAAFSLIWHANLYDVGKNIYLHASCPDFSLGGSTLLMSEEMTTMSAQAAADGRRMEALLLQIWANWTKPQQKIMEPWVADARRPRNEEERQLFRTCFRPTMRLLSWIGFGTHLFVLTVAAWTVPLDIRGIWIAYAILLGPMNLIAVALELSRKNRERRYEEALAALRGA